MNEEEAKTEEEIKSEVRKEIWKSVEHDVYHEARKKLEEEMNVEHKSLMVNVRVVQAICLGIFTMGLSMMAGDLTGAMELPISSLSMTTTLFGGMGGLMCEMFAGQAEKW